MSVVKIYASGNTLFIGGRTFPVNSGVDANGSSATGTDPASGIDYNQYVIVTSPDGEDLVVAPYDAIYKQDGTTNWGSSAFNTVVALRALFADDNPDNYGDATDVANNASEITAIKGRVTTTENDIADIEKAVQISTTTGGGRGIYYDDGKSTASSLLSVGDGAARMQAGSGTYIGLSEQSPGVQTFTVASGASGSETPYDALVLNGKTTANTASFDLQGGTRLGFVNGSYSVLLFPNTLTAARSINLPDASGTIALTSDIPNLLWTQSGNNIYYTTGNVGIGTTTPQSKLQVDGETVIGGGVTTGPVKLKILGTADRGGSIRAYADGFGSTGLVFGLEGTTSGDFQFQANVVPQGNLAYDLGNSGYVWNRVWAQKVTGRTNTSQGNLILNAGTTSNPIQFTIADTEYMRLNNDGNVGIGTNSPSEKLHVVGNVLAVNPTNQFEKTKLENNRIYFSRSSDGSYSTQIGTYTSSGGLWAQANQYVRITDGNRDYLTLRPSINNGNGGAFNMPFNSALFTHTISAYAEGDNLLRLYRADGLNNPELQINSTSDSINFKTLSDVGNTEFSWTQGASERMRIDSSGNVGIGTASPSYRLEVSGGDISLPLGNNIRFGGQLAIQKVNNGAMRFYAGTNSTTGGFDFATWNGASYAEGAFVIRNSGNVGIGTTNPGSKLSIHHNGGHTSGTISYTNATIDLYNPLEADTDEKGSIITFSDNYTDANGYNRTTRAAIKGGTDTTGNTANGFLAFYTDSAGANSAEERVRIDKDGNVGIGTTTPSEALHVVGNVVVDSGNSNVFIGDATTGDSITGADNIAIGTAAMRSATATSTYGVAIGSGAGRFGTQTHGMSIGFGAGYNGAQSSSYVGSQAGKNAAGQRNVGIGYLSGGGASNGVQSLYGNVSIGYGAGQVLETAATAVGYLALSALTTGTGNTALGYQAGDALTTGINNTILGYSAGGTNNSYTTLIGYDANADGNYGVAIGWLTKAGNFSTSVGTLAGGNSSTATYSVFIGDSAGRFNNSDRNVFIGRGAGYNSSTASDSIFIGYNAGYSETGSNKLYIENSNSTTPLIYGEFDNDLVRINGDLDVTGNTSTNAVDFDITTPPSLTDGRIAYDIDRETLVFQSEHGELAIGETYKPVYNNTGSTIAKGATVKATGVSGEKFLIELFDASSGVDEELYFIGVTQAAIPNATAGIVVSEGLVKHLDTSGYSVGTILYASETAGALTSTKPTSPNLGIPVAMVTKVDATNGTIYVRPDRYAHLNEIHDVSISSPANEHILRYNSTSGVWENAAPLWNDFTGFNFISTTYNVVTTGTLTVSNLTLGNASQATTTIGVSASEDLDITSKGNVTVKLDSDNNETNQKFRINDPSTTERFSVDDSGVVTINSEYSLPNTDGTAGYALVTDGVGNVDWADVGITESSIGQMYKESSQTLTGTFTAITSWDAEDNDDMSILDTTNGTLTITQAGKYLIQVDVHTNLSSGTARSTSEMYLDLGGTEVSGTRRGFYNRTTGNGETSATISYLYKHVSGTATFKIMVAQTAGTDTLYVDTALFNYATLGGGVGPQGVSGDAFDVGTETTSRNLTAGDHLKYLRSTASSAITFTVPPQSSVSWVDNAEIVFEQAGTGQITIAAGSGVTINSSETLKSSSQYAVIALKRVASDTWTLTGERELL